MPKRPRNKRTPISEAQKDRPEWCWIIPTGLLLALFGYWQFMVYPEWRAENAKQETQAVGQVVKPAPSYSTELGLVGTVILPPAALCLTLRPDAPDSDFSELPGLAMHWSTNKEMRYTLPRKEWYAGLAKVFEERGAGECE